MTTLYPPFHRRTIILSSPWDVGVYRQAAQRIYKERVGEPTRPDAVALYAYEDAIKDDPFDDRLPAQQQIPSPQDPLCAGTVAVFGEWIGRTLPANWDTSPFDLLSAQDEEKRFRLVHPWEEGAEETGGFPLTGSTFEVLTALAASETNGRSAPPLLILFIGPPSITDEPNAAAADWGNRALRDQITYDYRTKRAEMNRRLDVIDTHLRMLQNFNRYLDEVRGLVSKIVDTEEAAEQHMRRFFDRVIGENPQADPDDVFKGLGVFDVGDRSVFFGRESEVADALARIDALWERPEQPRIYWVRGPSGSGKSSFLRAGLIANIGTRGSSTPTPAKLVVRPNSLTEPNPSSTSGPEQGPTRQLLLRCLAAVLQSLPDGDTRLITALEQFDSAQGNTVERAAGIIGEVLGECSEGTDHSRRLVLGFDQFEEAVDLMEDARQEPAWSALISLLLRLVENPNIFVIATMRDDRAVALSLHPALEEVYTATKTGSPKLHLPSGADLSEIVRKPFTFVRDLVLDDDLIDTLIADVETFARRPGDANAHPASLLPLISLSLDRLYREVAKTEIETFRNFGAYESDGDPDETSARGEHENSFGRVAGRNLEAPAAARLTVDLCKAYRSKENDQPHDYFDVKNAITVLAEQAVAEARDESGPNWDDLEVSALLRRLVSWAGSPEQPFSLPAAEWPTSTTTLTLARAMKARRLIVPEDGERIRLIHEAVITHWPEARQWLDYERPLLKRLPALKTLAEDWSHEGKPADAVEMITNRFQDAAFRLLASHYELLIDADPEADPEHKAAMRDFALDALSKYGVPRERVEESARKPTHFLLAVAYRRIDIARRMLEVDPGVVDIPKTDGRTAIFVPAFYDDLPMLELLLAHGAGADTPDEKGWRPIHAAATKGALAAAKRLAQKDVVLTGQGAPGGTSPLQLAAAGGHLDLVRYLVKEKGVDLEAVDSNGQTALLRAVSADAVEALQTLIELGAQIDRTVHHDTPLDFGWSPLHVAANAGAVRAIEALLEKELDPTIVLKNGFTPLHIAAREGQVEIAGALVTALRKAGHSVDQPACDDWQGRTQNIVKRIEDRKTCEPHTGNGHFDITPLHLAIIHEQTAIVRLLLPFSDPNAMTGSGATALHVAASHGRTEIARLLIESGRCATEHRDAYGHRPLQSAIEAGHWTTARVMQQSAALGAGALVCKTVGGEEVEMTLLQHAAATGNRQALRFALHNAKNLTNTVNSPGPLGRTALHLAAIVGEPAAIGDLYEAGGDPFALDQRGLSPLHYAARRGDAVALGELLANAETSEPLGAEAAPSLLHLAARAGKEDAVARIIDQGWNTDAQDAFGYTPLHRAIEAGSLRVAQQLLEAGASLIAPAENHQHTALMLAARAGSLEIVDWLLAQPGLQPNSVPPQGRTPLLTAIAYRHYAIAERLIRAGADPKPPDSETGLTIADLYTRQIHQADAYGLYDRRHEGLETALQEAGFALTLKPFTNPKTAPPPSRKRVERDRVATSRLVTTTPGATGFFPEFMPKGGADAWTAVPDKERAGFLEQISPVDGKWPLDTETAIVSWRQLPFYDSVALISIRNSELDERNTRLFYLTDQGKLFRLNGTSPPIHEVNAKAPIKINEDNVLDYLRFFCFFVRGEEGPFYIAEDADDPLLPRFTEEAAQSVLEGTVRPASFDGKNQHGHFICSSVVNYSNAIFIANFAVQPTGMLEMLNDEPIATDLPGRVSWRLS
ncbi:ankyrin repeat domain-containing protein [Halomonas sp. 1390]|uniref:ankyrin repeat domain-containing protein n=1 Tax=Halomonas sp. B23F22_3 TaxID=3459516 RepID=UPI00373EF4FD